MYKIPPVPIQGDAAAWAVKAFAAGMIGMMLSFGVLMMFMASFASLMPPPYVPPR
jgi:hypothetical protein